MTILNERVARARGWRQYLAGSPFDYCEAGSLARADLTAAKQVRTTMDGWPDYEHDPRLWARLLEEMSGSVGFYRGVGWGASSKPPMIYHGKLPGTAVCEAWLEWDADRKADEP